MTQKPKKFLARAASGPKTCIIDIETSPGVAQVWGLFKQNIGLNQLQETTRVISFAAKWKGSKDVMFFSEFHDGRKKMVSEAHRILSEADIVVHYNGSSFDIPHLKREFLLARLSPPAPFLEIDLLKAVKRHFRFMSNKLQHVCSQLRIGRKIDTGGHDLWVKCLLGDANAWNRMRKYNKHDVVLTEELYVAILPWIDNHPHVGLAKQDPRDACNRCGSTSLQYRGLAQTNTIVYKRFQCQQCGGWGRGNSKVAKVNTRGVK